MLGVRTGSADCRQCRILSPEKFRYRVAVSMVPLGGGECASLGVMIMVKGYGKREGSQGQEVQGEKGEGHGKNGGGWGVRLARQKQDDLLTASSRELWCR